MITKTIAPSGADYTSLSLAEASIPGSSSDDFTLEYVAAFTDTTACVIGVASFTGTILVTVAAPYRCNGAISGGHAELNYGVDNVTVSLTITSIPNVTVQHLRIIRNTTAFATNALFCLSCDNLKIQNCVIVRRTTTVGGSPFYFNECTNVVYSGNNLVVTGFNNAAITMCAFYRAGAVTSVKVYRNKFLFNGVAATAVLACWGNTNVDAQQNVVIIAAGTVTNGGYDTGFGGVWHANCDSNVSSVAADCPGTNANNSESASDVFTTTTIGSENLDYPSAAKMMEQHIGNDLSADVGLTDNKGRNIEDWYPGSDFAVDTNRHLHVPLGLPGFMMSMIGGAA